MKDKGRRQFAAGIMAVILALSVSFPQHLSAAEVKAAEGNELRFWYGEPASKGVNILSAGMNYDTEEQNTWQQQTLPIGNGDIGANVYGEIVSEHLTFNEKTLWTGGPSDSRPGYMGGNSPDNGKYGETLKEVQRLFQEGNTSAAHELCNQLTGISDGYGAYQAWGDIYFDFSDITESKVNHYERDLDLKTAISSVVFTEGHTSYAREYFVSHPDNVLVARLEADGADKMNFDIRFESKQGGSTVAHDDMLMLCGEVSDNQLQYASYLKVVPEDGKVTGSGNKLTVTDASAVTVYVSAVTDYKNEYPEYRTGETMGELEAKLQEIIALASDKGYADVKQDHIEDYQSLFNRVSLDLGYVVSSKTTDKLLEAYKNGTASMGEMRQLEGMLFQYGRYLTIASSREDSKLPSNLQGVWNCLNNPPWASDYHLNVNLQMNYWPTYSTNLAECSLPLIDYVDSLREPGRVTAAIYAGVVSEDGEENGFMAHTQNTPFGWTCPGWVFDWGWSPAAVPWILQNCWEYYEFTGDVEYMKKYIYPMLKEEALLYDQMLVKDEDGYLVSAPSFSPEHGPRTAGNTYEQSLIWQLYEDAATAAEILNVDEELAAGWRENQANLKGPIEIGDDGQIKEWYHETSYNKDQYGNVISPEGYNHRHISHMLGLFPGDLIATKDEWLEAAKVSMGLRTDQTTGWGMGQRINTWARLGEGNKAHELITELFENGIYPNLWDTHAPFQIDGNFGYTSGVAEMLLQSNMGYINLLPALPDAWSEGSIEGLVARGNFEISMDWKDKSLTEVTLLSNNGGTAVIEADNISYAEVTDSKGNIVQLKAVNSDRASFETKKGETYTITNFPRKVQNLSAERINNSMAVLSWDALKAEGENDITYTVYRQASDGNVKKIAEDLTECTFVDEDDALLISFLQTNELHYRVEAVCKGAVFAQSDLQLLTDSHAARAGKVDDQDSRIVYKGDWQNWDEPDDYNGTIKYLENPKGGETATLAFIGTGIEFITCTNFDRGELRISIDGVDYGTFDTYSANTTRKVVILSETELDYGLHTIVVTATNTVTDTSMANGNYKSKIEVDAFHVIDESVNVDVKNVDGITTVTEADSTVQLEAEITPADTKDKTVSWTSSDEKIASVDENGLVAFHKRSGTVLICAQSNAYPHCRGGVLLTADMEGYALPFIDVTESDWFYDGVYYNYFAKTMTGKDETHFAPLENLARAQFAVIIHRMQDEPKMEYTAKFPDVAEKIWYTDAILWAESAGVVTGYTGTGLFGPADNINREQMAVMMYRYAKYLKYDVSRTTDFNKFEDAANVNEFAKEAMKWAVGNGIITGKYEGTKIDPQGNALRAECALIIQRFMEKYEK